MCIASGMSSGEKTGAKAYSVKNRSDFGKSAGANAIGDSSRFTDAVVKSKQDQGERGLIAKNKSR
jgi:hypothetical protein